MLTRRSRWKEGWAIRAVGLPLGVCLIVLFVAAAAWAGPETPRQRVLFFAVDALEWDVINPLLEQGKLPRLKALIDRGAAAHLVSETPYFSPQVWTSVATGKVSEKHGIRSFIQENGGSEQKRPVNTSNFKALTLWRILSRLGSSVGVAGWWPSWPARPVRGLLLSDYSWPHTVSDDGIPTQFDRGPQAPYSCYPDRAAVEMKPFITSEMKVPREGINFLARMWYHARDYTFQQASLYFLKKYQPDFCAVYTESVDCAQHFVWPDYLKYHNIPMVIGDREWDVMKVYRKTPKEIEERGPVIDQFCQMQDNYIGQFLDRMDVESRIIVIASDHGFGTNVKGDVIDTGHGKPTMIPFWHHPEGVLIIAGGPIVPGATPVRPSVLDLAPTILYLMGYPVARDMDGRVLTEIIDPQYLAANPLTYVETYETGEGATDAAPRADSLDEDMMMRLKALGYLE